MITFIVKGGWVMYPIILGSVIGFAIVIERFLVFRGMRFDTFKFIQQIFKDLKNNEVDKALEACNTIDHPVAVIFKIGIERRNLPAQRLEKILEQTGNNQIQKLEKNLGALVSIVGIEPMLGFLGTITGLIRAFMSWEQAGANVTVSALASGIYEAMITTAAGLIIAIPLYLCYNYFVSRIKVTANELTNHGIQLLEAIAELKGLEK
ncbi:MAG: MotA/TolQ/ExbB proton channel family protein [Candidatus Omnitrophica bacterium]|nr:MotA/TolQ/ExbB proton channel family protein [Candidatus Omnitrophota bacterium]